MGKVYPERQMKAVWKLDYDYRVDKCYNRPCCPVCWEDSVPVLLSETDETKGECISCHDEFELDERMIKWLKKRSECKETTETCFRCGKKTLKVTSRRNPVNLKWESCGGECSECGIRFIV